MLGVLLVMYTPGMLAVRSPYLVPFAMNGAAASARQAVFVKCYDRHLEGG